MKNKNIRGIYILIIRLDLMIEEISIKGGTIII